MNDSEREAVIEAARCGEPDAIERLLLLCEPDITRFARQVCTTPEDMEDTIQEALWIVSRKIGTLRTLAAFTGWVFQVVRHECSRIRRQRQREQPIDDALEQIAAPNDIATQISMRRDVAVALAALDMKYREVLLLRDVQQQTAPEAAATLGISVDAVKSRLHRGRAMLRSHLNQWA